ncbi:MAG: orotidine-5'-phosphate decarboxylase [Candidatus Omnitrophica bacterium]|nr:orotidine-5'-phosphate decarboxylase [Candidatus Omnitrophota bacterium]MCM8830772.1 orotidine-5'-phosphate decarboxylase [Candidatus Omnitrophota bacterium]
MFNRLIVALDVDDKKKIKNLVKELAPKGFKFKVGLISFTKFGPSLVKELVNQNIDVFLDLKLFDIPNTMCKTARIITKLGCWAFTVHIKAGRQSLEAVKKEVEEVAKNKKIRKPLILGVTELTSQNTSPFKVLNLAKIALECGLDGVICSANDLKLLKTKIKNKSFLFVSPAVRLEKIAGDDQKRIATVREAKALGADYMVIGRPILEAKDINLVLEKIRSELK